MTMMIRDWGNGFRWVGDIAVGKLRRSATGATVVEEDGREDTYDEPRDVFVGRIYEEGPGQSRKCLIKARSDVPRLLHDWMQRQADRWAEGEPFDYGTVWHRKPKATDAQVSDLRRVLGRD